MQMGFVANVASYDISKVFLTEHANIQRKQGLYRLVQTCSFSMDQCTPILSALVQTYPVSNTLVPTVH